MYNKFKRSYFDEVNIDNLIVRNFIFFLFMIKNKKVYFYMFSLFVFEFIL